MRRALVPVLALVLLAPGCAVFYRGPRGVESALEDQLGVNLDREFGFKLGWTSTKLVGSFVGDGDEEDTLALKELTGIGVAIFQIPAGAEGAPRLDARKLGLRGWETVVNSREGQDQALILAKSNRHGFHEMVMVAVDAQEVVVVRLRGNLDRIIEAAVKGEKESGPRGARAAVPVSAGGGAETD